jgi:hypothetical protein
LAVTVAMLVTHLSIGSTKLECKAAISCFAAALPALCAFIYLAERKGYGPTAGFSEMEDLLYFAGVGLAVSGLVLTFLGYHHLVGKIFILSAGVPLFLYGWVTVKEKRRYRKRENRRQPNVVEVPPVLVPTRHPAKVCLILTNQWPRARRAFVLPLLPCRRGLLEPDP